MSEDSMLAIMSRNEGRSGEGNLPATSCECIFQVLILRSNGADHLKLLEQAKERQLEQERCSICL
jgi:hypothetical protein